MGFQPSFRVVSFDPSTGAGLAAAVGDIAQLSGGGQAWIKLGTGATDWTDVTQLGGGGGSVVADGVSLDGVGTLADPLAIIPGYVTALGGWTRIDQSITGQNMDIAVTGDTAHVIEVIGYSVNANAGASTVSVQPQGAATNTKFQGIGSGSSDVTFGEHSTALAQCAFAPGSGAASFQFRMYLKTGTVRFYHGSYTSISGANAITNHGSLSGIYADTSTAITSVRIGSDRADGMASGSFLLWRAIN
jgi:hypothetical protein